MTDLNSFSLKVANFKCFGANAQGFEGIKPFNLIIGRNNSGKSTLLDLLQSVVVENYNFHKSLWRSDKQPEIIAKSVLTESEIKKVFSARTGGGSIGINHFDFGKRFIGASITWKLSPLLPGDDKRFMALSDTVDGKRPLDRLRDRLAYEEKLAQSMPNPLAQYNFRRLRAERDIVPEKDAGAGSELNDNGAGATALIQDLINRAEADSDVVEKQFLKQINAVVEPDISFSRILCQKIPTGEWEIYLEEKHKGRVALSQSGSGIKTIILALANLHLIPYVNEKSPETYIYALEELENNLHPAILRRLISYLLDFAHKHGCLFFLTTHSGVLIDLLSKKDDCQILHVTHNQEFAECKTVTTYFDNHGVLDDLDVRASDLLQSNCVIWVEGPSDRIYINRWIHIYSEGRLKEDIHYQCVFYGGRLLSHLEASAPEETKDGIAMLRVNRNCCVVIDSDKNFPQTPLNTTKERIISEVAGISGITWVTKGREIENYLPAKAIAKAIGEEDLEQPEQYQKFAEYLDESSPATAKRYLKSKSNFAEMIVPHLEDATSLDVLDLRAKICELCDRIRGWNGID